MEEIGESQPYFLNATTIDKEPLLDQISKGFIQDKDCIEVLQMSCNFCSLL